MFGRIFGKPKEAGAANTILTLDKLEETIHMLEKKEGVINNKIVAEVERARAFTRAKNKKAAIACLKRKKMYENQVEQIGNFQLRLHDQMIMLEGAKATAETVDALRSGAQAMKHIQTSTNIDDVDKTMDDINEQSENMKQIQDALGTPIGADFDDEELEEELAELEAESELFEEHYPPAPVNPVPIPQPTPNKVPKTAEDDELAALQAEMAM